MPPAATELVSEFSPSGLRFKIAAGPVPCWFKVKMPKEDLTTAIFAGALVDYLCEVIEVRLNDGARLAWDCFENHGRVLLGALEVSRGGANLRRLGYDDDIQAAADVCHVDFCENAHARFLGDHIPGRRKHRPMDDAAG